MLDINSAPHAGRARSTSCWPTSHARSWSTWRASTSSTAPASPCWSSSTRACATRAASSHRRRARSAAGHLQAAAHGQGLRDLGPGLRAPCCASSRSPRSSPTLPSRCRRRSTGSSSRRWPAAAQTRRDGARHHPVVPGRRRCWPAGRAPAAVASGAAASRRIDGLDGAAPAHAVHPAHGAGAVGPAVRGVDAARAVAPPPRPGRRGARLVGLPRRLRRGAGWHARSACRRWSSCTAPTSTSSRRSLGRGGKRVGAAPRRRGGRGEPAAGRRRRRARRGPVAHRDRRQRRRRRALPVRAIARPPGPRSACPPKRRSRSTSATSSASKGVLDLLAAVPHARARGYPTRRSPGRRRRGPARRWRRRRRRWATPCALVGPMRRRRRGDLDGGRRRGRAGELGRGHAQRAARGAGVRVAASSPPPSAASQTSCRAAQLGTLVPPRDPPALADALAPR
jgi:hypothetical protein